MTKELNASNSSHLILGVGYHGDEKCIVMVVEEPELVLTVGQAEALVRQLEFVIDRAKEMGTREEVKTQGVTIFPPVTIELEPKGN